MNLLNYQEIETLITSLGPNPKAKVICVKIESQCFIKNDAMYTLQPNITYKVKTSNYENELLTIVTQLIEDSFNALNENEKQQLKADHSKTYQTIFKNASVKLYQPQLYTMLTRNDVIFDTTPAEIHFENGYMDMRTSEFKKRNPKTHFIMHYIARDYVQSTHQQRKKVRKELNKVYPIAEDLTSILSVLGSALSWESSRDQTVLFLLGKGSSAKSFTMQLLQLTIGPYLKELKEDTFEQGNKDTNKIMNSYRKENQILITWINELAGRINASLFKGTCEGSIKLTQLYSDGCDTVTHSSKIIGTLNEMPDVKMDSGIVRRVRAMTHMSKFTEIEEEINIEKNIYLKVKDLHKEMAKMNLLNAFFDILSIYCKHFLDGNDIVYSANCEETKADVVNVNDHFQDFIDMNFIKTDNPTDFIGKENMNTLFKACYPAMHLKPIQILASLKDKGLIYKPSERGPKNVRGIYVGIKLKPEKSVFKDDDDDDDESDAIPSNCVLKSDYDELKKQYDLLMIKHVEDEDLNIFKKTEVKVKKSKKEPIKVEITEEHIPSLVQKPVKSMFNKSVKPEERKCEYKKSSYCSEDEDEDEGEDNSNNLADLMDNIGRV